jgi:hypothetical protein
MARAMRGRTLSSQREAVVAHLPDGLRHTDVRELVCFDPALVIQREGDCFVAEVGAFDPSDARVRNHFHVGGKQVQLRPGDRVPLVLAYRRSMMEFASATSSYAFNAGDTVWILGGDGYAGSFECADPDYGTPVSAAVLGALVGRDRGRALNVGDFEPPARESVRPAADGALVVAVVGSRMDCGKSTAIRRITAELRRRGRRVGAGKLTGFGCRHEVTSLGADLCLDFTDYGLPSTCGGDGQRVRRTARRILDGLRAEGPEIVVLELGEALIGPYRVDEVLAEIRPQIDVLIFVAFDLCGVEGGIHRLHELGMGPDFVTGPVANTSVAAELVARRHGIPTESSRGEMPELIADLERRLRARPRLPARV